MSCENLSLNKNCKKEKFWLEDFKELYIDNNFLKFFPQYEMTRTEQLNALTRFFIYYFILLLIFGKEQHWLLLPIVGIVVIIIIYNIHKNDDKSGEKELERILNIRRQKKEKEQEYLEK